jgi:hypothetical protein
MPADFENAYNPESMSDEELERALREELESLDTVDADNILVRVRDGVVHLAGRVGTDPERRIAEHVVTDVLGVARYENAIVVDPVRRDLEPEDTEAHLANEAESDHEPLGQPLEQQSDTAEHRQENLDAELYGTHDVQQAIERGTAWEPPDSPTPEGYPGEEPDVRQYGEEH